MPLIEVEQFKAIYGRIVGSMRFEEIGALIDGADALMASYCSFPINDAGTVSLSSQSYTLYYDRPGRIPTTLCLGVAPVTAVASVHMDAARAYDSDTLLVEGTDFDLDIPNGRLDLLPSSATTRWIAARRAIKVTFTGGYDPTPPDLIPLTAYVVQAMLDRPALQQQQSASLGGVSVTTTDLDNVLPAAVRAALDAGYKLAGCC